VRSDRLDDGQRGARAVGALRRQHPRAPVARVGGRARRRRPRGRAAAAAGRRRRRRRGEPEALRAPPRVGRLDELAHAGAADEAQQRERDLLPVVAREAAHQPRHKAGHRGGVALHGGDAAGGL
jgi:hypothetical protein